MQENTEHGGVQKLSFQSENSKTGSNEDENEPVTAISKFSIFAVVIRKDFLTFTYVNIITGAGPVV